jgi:hypothetical protein
MATVVTLSSHYAGQISDSSFEFVVRGPLFSGLKAEDAYSFSRFSGQLLGIVSIYLFSLEPPSLNVSL